MKLVFNPGAGECHWIDGNYSDTSAAGQWYLFNLTSDPRETHDLKGELPRLFVELQAAHKLWVESVQASRSNETLCDRTPPPAPPGPPGVCLFPYPLPICVSDFCIPLRTVLPGPPAPPAPPIADAFVLSLEANPALCVTVVPGGTHPRVVLAVCSAGHKAQAWLQQATNGDDLGIVAASITGKGGSFLKVAEKDYPKGHACDPGDALTIGGATSGKVHTYFTWQAAAPEVNAGPSGLGRLLCAGCEGMCAGAGTNMTELVGCTGGTAELVGRGWHA
jgi:hypothetical protein